MQIASDEPFGFRNGGKLRFAQIDRLRGGISTAPASRFGMVRLSGDTARSAGKSLSAPGSESRRSRWSVSHPPKSCRRDAHCFPGRTVPENTCRGTAGAVLPSALGNGAQGNGKQSS